MKQVWGDVCRQTEGIRRGLNLIALLYDRNRRFHEGSLPLDHFEQEGFRVRSVPIGPDVIKQLEEIQPSLILIETITSTGPAMEVCGQVRRTRSFVRVPIILIASNASEEERVVGLEAGADDYISEPCSRREVIARIRAVMRRISLSDNYTLLPSVVRALGSKITAGDIEIDSTEMRISVRGNEVRTTDLEFRLLYYLVHNQARVFSRDQLLDAVWGPQNVDLRTVDACVRRLRRKIELDPLRPAYLKTVRGAGYCWRVSA